MKSPKKAPTWAEVRESLRKLHRTLDKVEAQLSGKPSFNLKDLWKDLFP